MLQSIKCSPAACQNTHYDNSYTISIPYSQVETINVVPKPFFGPGEIESLGVVFKSNVQKREGDHLRPWALYKVGFDTLGKLSTIPTVFTLSTVSAKYYYGEADVFCKQKNECFFL